MEILWFIISLPWFVLKWTVVAFVWFSVGCWLKDLIEDLWEFRRFK